MTAKEYLSQAYRLDQRIDSNIAEITRLREMACGISSPSWEEKVQTSRNTDAPFVRCLEKIMDLEKVVNNEIDTLVDLKRQIRTTVDTIANVNERMVLRYRYIHNMTWEQIGGEMIAPFADGIRQLFRQWFYPPTRFGSERRRKYPPLSVDAHLDIMI